MSSRLPVTISLRLSRLEMDLKSINATGGDTMIILSIFSPSLTARAFTQAPKEYPDGSANVLLLANTVIIMSLAAAGASKIEP